MSTTILLDNLCLSPGSEPVSVSDPSIPASDAWPVVVPFPADPASVRPKQGRRKAIASRASNTLRPALRRVFLRELPPVTLDFLSWFWSTFPSLQSSRDPLLAARLLHSTLFYSARGEEQPLDYYFLASLIPPGLKMSNGRRDRSTEWLKIEISEALQHQYNRHNWKQHLASNIQLDRHLAMDLLTDWNRFILPAKHPEAHDAGSLILDGSRPQKTSAGEYKNTIQKSLNIVRRHRRQQDDRDPHLGPILNYLNQHRTPPAILLDRMDGRIRWVEEHRDQAVELALDEAARKHLRRTYGARFHALHVCREAAAGGSVWVRASEDNYRIFTQGYSLANIKREDRRAITRFDDGLVEVDLASAHLAIANKLFGGPAISGILRLPKVWPELLAWIKYEDNEDDKAVLKQTVYAMLYGSSPLRQQTLLIRDPDGHKFIKEKLDKAQRAVETSRDRAQARGNLQITKDVIKSILRKERDTKRTYRQLRKHPAIRELLQNRDRYARDILAADGATDAFGVFHRVTDEISPSRIISSITSSYEKALLLPIYQAAAKSTDFFVVFDQHDGLTIFLRRHKEQVRAANLIKRLQQAVKQRADELGIITHLEVKNI